MVRGRVVGGGGKRRVASGDPTPLLLAAVMYARFAAVAALVNVAAAFSDTAPVVAWASKR